MENINVSTIGLSDAKIEDGFEYGDWRDQWVSDTLYSQFINTKISIFGHQINKGRLSRRFTSILIVAYFLQ